MQIDLFDAQLATRVGFHSISSDNAAVHLLAEHRLILYSHFLSQPCAGDFFASIDASTPWRQASLRIAGKQIEVPRLQCWMGDAHCHYAYSGLRLSPEPWSEPALDIRNLLKEFTGVDYNCVLINKYRDGNDSVSWHSDDEPQLGPSPQIASLSLGATREFQFKSKVAFTHEKYSSRSMRYSLQLKTGSLLIMEPGIQERWLHRVPKTKHNVQARINLTFRNIAI